MAHTCRGTISLHGALIHTENPASFNFVVSNGGGTQVGADSGHHTAIVQLRFLSRPFIYGHQMRWRDRNG